MCVTAFCHCRLRSAQKLLAIFIILNGGRRATTTARTKQKMTQKMREKVGPVKWGALSGSFPCFSARFSSLFSRFTASPGTPLHFGAVVVILSKDLHYNLLCENSTHSSIPAPIPIPLHHPLPFRFHFRSIPLSFG